MDTSPLCGRTPLPCVGGPHYFTGKSFEQACTQKETPFKYFRTEKRQKNMGAQIMAPKLKVIYPALAMVCRITQFYYP